MNITSYKMTCLAAVTVIALGAAPAISANTNVFPFNTIIANAYAAETVVKHKCVVKAGDSFTFPAGATNCKVILTEGDELDTGSSIGPGKTIRVKTGKVKVTWKTKAKSQ